MSKTPVKKSTKPATKQVKRVAPVAYEITPDEAVTLIQLLEQGSHIAQLGKFMCENSLTGKDLIANLRRQDAAIFEHFVGLFKTHSKEVQHGIALDICGKADATPQEVASKQLAMRLSSERAQPATLQRYATVYQYLSHKQIKHQTIEMLMDANLGVLEGLAKGGKLYGKDEKIPANKKGIYVSTLLKDVASSTNTKDLRDKLSRYLPKGKSSGSNGRKREPLSDEAQKLLLELKDLVTTDSDKGKVIDFETALRRAITAITNKMQPKARRPLEYTATNQVLVS